MTTTAAALELLTPDQMGLADRLTIEAGTPGLLLMDRAGAAVAAEALAMLEPSPGPVLVLCGPGNNGGDGVVAACRLRALGVPVRLAVLGGTLDVFKGDAAAVVRAWHEGVEEATTAPLVGVALAIDALFGAGLARRLDGAAADLVARLNGSGCPVLAVDLPSGISGRTGAALGPAVQAHATVTFFRLKPGHVLEPGRSHAGRCVLADIGIAAELLAGMMPLAALNRPALWDAAFPWPTTAGHKYTRGHAVVVSGATTTGAARLSARAALRVGAGLVTVASPAEAMAVNGAHLTSIMLRASEGPDGLAAVLADPRKSVVVLGPGLGVGAATRDLVATALAPGREGTARAAVLDADALTSFAGEADALARLIASAPGPVVLTPHDGEFDRLFGRVDGSRLDRAREGARRLGATLLLKGPDTVVAEADGRAGIAEADAPMLATAGSGDVLSGLVGGLLAQGMPAFAAANSAVWIHAAAARRFGVGLISEDLPEVVPAVLAALQAGTGASPALRTPSGARRTPG